MSDEARPAEGPAPGPAPEGQPSSGGHEAAPAASGAAPASPDAPGGGGLTTEDVVRELAGIAPERPESEEPREAAGDDEGHGEGRRRKRRKKPRGGPGGGPGGEPRAGGEPRGHGSGRQLVEDQLDRDAEHLARDARAVPHARLRPLSMVSRQVRRLMASRDARDQREARRALVLLKSKVAWLAGREVGRERSAFLKVRDAVFRGVDQLVRNRDQLDRGAVRNFLDHVDAFVGYHRFHGDDRRRDRAGGGQVMNGTRNGPLRFRAHVVIAGELECLSGLHVGGNRDALAMSGVDLPVARDPATGLPFIPGSTLKGRMRGLLETLRGRGAMESAAGEPEAAADPIDLLFGARGRRFGPTRLVVRDAMPLTEGPGRRGDRDTVEWWHALDTDGLGTEVKAETSINRVTAAAWPRQVERVLAGSRFGVEFVLHLYDLWPDEERLLKDVLVALTLVEDSYLGGHGSRGYGKVQFRLLDKPLVTSARDYEGGRRRAEPGGERRTLDAIDPEAWIAAVREHLGKEA